MRRNHTLKKWWFATGIIACLLAVNLTSYAFADELVGADNCVTSSLVESQEQETNTFYQVDGKWYYLGENGVAINPWFYPNISIKNWYFYPISFLPQTKD